MDIALLTANANQLRFLITYNAEEKTFYFTATLIVLSLLIQIAVGIGMIYKVWVQIQESLFSGFYALLFLTAVFRGLPAFKCARCLSLIDKKKIVNISASNKEKRKQWQGRSGRQLGHHRFILLGCLKCVGGIIHNNLNSSEIHELITTTIEMSFNKYVVYSCGFEFTNKNIINCEICIFWCIGLQRLGIWQRSRFNSNFELRGRTFPSMNERRIKGCCDCTVSIWV